MRIEYNVLWVEDVKSWYKDNLELAQEYLEDLGFRLTSKLCKSFAEVRAEYDKNKLKDYDLLLVDYTLAGSPSGDEIINFIRSQKENPILTDVIFYSNDIQSVRDSIKKFELEGVYTSHRTDFTDKFELVVDTKIKKIQEVNTMRGLIMSETSDLDELMLGIVQKLLKSKDALTYESYIKKEISDTVKNVSKKLDAEEITVADKIKDSRLFTSFHRAKCINKLYKHQKIGIDKFFESYSKDVLESRNIFAHVKESIENGEKVLISHITGKKEVFNDKRCIEIRLSLINYRRVLEKINLDLKALA